MGSMDGYAIAEKNSEPITDVQQRSETLQQRSETLQRDSVDKMIDEYWEQHPDKDPCNKPIAIAYGLC